jgi:hypothetical protein
VARTADVGIADALLLDMNGGEEGRTMKRDTRTANVSSYTVGNKIRFMAAVGNEAGRVIYHGEASLPYGDGLDWLTVENGTLEELGVKAIVKIHRQARQALRQGWLD